MPVSVGAKAGSRMTSVRRIPYFTYRAGRSILLGIRTFLTGILCSRSWTSPKGHSSPHAARPNTTPNSISVPST